MQDRIVLASSPDVSLSMRKGRRDSESWRDVSSLVFLPHFHDILHLFLSRHSPRLARPSKRVWMRLICVASERKRRGKREIRQLSHYP